jgi:hypothetical protein
MSTTYSIYWLHLDTHTDYNTQGYIGVSNNPEYRLKQHKKDSKKLINHIHKALACYGGSVKQKVLASGLDKEAAFLVELMLRPKKCVGWNIAVGGFFSPDNVGRKHSEESRRNMGLSHIGKSKNAGLSNPNCTLKPEVIIAVYNDIAAGIKQSHIARKHSVTDSSVSAIKLMRRDYYKQVINNYLGETNMNEVKL